MKIKTKKPMIDNEKRALLKALSAAGMASTMGGAIPSFLFQSTEAKAQAGTPHRILQIFLEGGWDSILATDPVQSGSSKALGGNFEASYHDGSVANFYTQVPGKNQLFVGSGMFNALPSFAAVPTAFMNGMFVEVTAHELAVNYMLSGQLSTSRSREYPAMIAMMAEKRGGFPAHVILGSGIPLAETKKTTPPLQSLDIGQFIGLLAGPRASSYYNMSEDSIAAAHTLISKLNSEHDKKISQNAIKGLAPWKNAEQGLDALYDKRYDQSIVLTNDIKTDYGIQNDQYGTMQAKLAGAFMVLREGLTPYVTVKFGGFDTHQAHIGTHLPLQQSFGTVLNQLISDLQTTDDPEAAGQKLIDTTTVVISSDFTRTPTFNLSAGTDHWQTGSTIVMGKGVKDNINIGRTDDTGAALGWVAGSTQPLSASTALLPDHLASSLLRLLGYTEEADSISAVHLSEVFEG